MRGYLELPKALRDTYNYRPSPVLLLRLAAAPFARPRVRTHDLGYVVPALVAAGSRGGVGGILTAKVVAARHCGGIILLFDWRGKGGCRKSEGSCEGSWICIIRIEVNLLGG